MAEYAEWKQEFYRLAGELPRIDLPSAESVIIKPRCRCTGLVGAPQAAGQDAVLARRSSSFIPGIHMNVSFRIFHGPSIHAPFAAVRAEFTNPHRSRLPVSVIEAQWRLIDGKLSWGGRKPPELATFAELATGLAINLLHPEDADNANAVAAAGADDGPGSICLGFVDARAAALALRTALELAAAIFAGASGQNIHRARLQRQLRRTRAVLVRNQPQDPIVRTLFRAARQRGIPVYPVAGGSCVWLFGQGAAGVHYFEAGSEHDSFTGMNLARNKTWANRLVLRLGFPGVTHGVATQQAEAFEIARQLGYPVVVKPIANGKGRGVSAYVVDEGELAIAFANPAALSRRGVIVERHVAGHDYRLAVFGGKLAWVAARYPASVVGDGCSTVAELIALENCRRRQDPAAKEGGLLQLKPDEDMLLHLRKQGLSLASLLPAGTMIKLRSVANISKGGSIADVTDRVHPDNREMAEAIARSFRMDAIGVDLITPDITRSWREVPCAVIEVNGTPGIFYDERAARVLQARFPANSDGRIPSVLLVDAHADMLTRVAAVLVARGFAVGQTDDGETQLAGHSRCRPGTALHGRVMALVSDPSCQALAIATNAKAITASGLPLDRFDLALCFAPLPQDLQDAVRSCCGRLVDDMPHTVADAELVALLEKVLQQYAGLRRSWKHVDRTEARDQESSPCQG